MEEGMEFRYLLKIIKRHIYVLYYTLGAALVIALLVNILVPPTYESTATLRVKYSGKATDLLGTLSAEDLMRQQIFTYAEIVRSKAVIEAMIDKKFGDAEKRPTYEEMMKRIDITPVKNTEILSISVQAGTPEEAQSMANILLDSFLGRLGEIVRAEGRDSRIFLGERVAEAQKNLDRLQKELVDYKKNKETVSATNQTTLFLDRQATLIRQAADNEQALAGSQAKINSIRGQISQQDSGFFANNPLIQQFKGRLADQEIEMVNLRKTLSVNHPRVISLQAAITATRSRLQEEITKVIREESPSGNPVHLLLQQNQVQAEMDQAVAQIQNAVIQKQLDQSKQELLSLPEKEQGLARLNLEYSVAESNYTMLAHKYEEARIAEITQPTNVQIVDEAWLPERPVKPQRLLNLGVAVILGLFAGLSGTFLVEYFSKTLDSMQDVKRYLGLPVLGSIPRYEVPRGRNLSRRRPSWWKNLLNRTVGGQRNA